MSLTNMVRAERGYLVNTYTKIKYPFQFNPSELSDNKQVTWGKREGISPQSAQGTSRSTGSLSPTSAAHESPVEALARRFSKADFRKFDSEGDRTISISKLAIDGRETMPDEPSWRRNEEGDILSDLAFLRSLVYPKAGNSMHEILAMISRSNAKTYAEEHVNQPPTVILAFGDLVMEGYVSSVNITETLFNDKLNPVRAEVSITLIEKVDSLTCVMDAINRLRRASHRANF